MVTGLDALFLEVNNLEESLSFYRDQLGFVLESHNSDAEPPMATVRAGALKINLVQQLETMLRRARRHFVLGVEDVDALFAKSLPSIIVFRHHAMRAGVAGLSACWIPTIIDWCLLNGMRINRSEVREWAINTLKSSD